MLENITSSVQLSPALNCDSVNLQRVYKSKTQTKIVFTFKPNSGLTTGADIKINITSSVAITPLSISRAMCWYGTTIFGVAIEGSQIAMRALNGAPPADFCGADITFLSS